ncbi:MAG: hypothetical protein ABL931_12995 [Usitatibacteraceae bacterium]
MLKNIGIIAIVVMFGVFALFAFTGQPRVGNAPVALARTIQTLKIVQTEMYQSELKFAESNAQIAPMLGGAARLGKVEDAGPVVEVNVRAGGVIEFLLSAKDKEGKQLRAIFLPRPQQYAGGGPIYWECYSANWQYVPGFGAGCRFEKTADDIEKQHIAQLRAVEAKLVKDAEDARAKELEVQANRFVERQREQNAREAERNRDE